jgi:hypothetical protein
MSSDSLASKVALRTKLAAPRKKKAPPSKDMPTKREILNVGKIEADGLSKLEIYLGAALDDLAKIEKDIDDRVKGYAEDEEVSVKDVPEKVYYPKDISEVIKDLERGARALSDSLQKVVDVTLEQDLADAVEGFARSLYADTLDDPKEDKDSVAKSKSLLTKALGLVPNAITGPGALRNLQKCFELMTQVANTLSESSVKAPKIPNALEDEDPRQLGFDFAASTKTGTEVINENTRRAFVKMAMEFDTQDALEKYLKAHPKANKSKHTVKKPKEEAKEPVEEKKTQDDEGGGDYEGNDYEGDTRGDQPLDMSDEHVAKEYHKAKANVDALKKIGPHGMRKNLQEFIRAANNLYASMATIDEDFDGEEWDGDDYEKWDTEDIDEEAENLISELDKKIKSKTKFTATDGETASRLGSLADVLFRRAERIKSYADQDKNRS